MFSSIKKYLISNLAIIMIPNLVGCLSLFSRDQEGRGFYIIGRDEIREILKSVGYSEEFSEFFDRDSTGSMLRLFNWDDKKALIVPCEGKIREVSLKGQKSWLNDDLEVVAWWNNQKLYIHDKEIAFSERYVYMQEYSGNYFFRMPKWNPYDELHDDRIEVFSVDHPDQPLIEGRMFSSIAKLFAKNNKIYLADSLLTDGDVIKFYIYEIKNRNLVKIDEISLDRDRTGSSPFYVVDMSPWNDEVIAVDIHDFPSPSKLFEFNLATQEKRSLGRNYDTKGFYMQCNILNKILRENVK